MSKFEDKEYFELELENGKKLKLTGEHPVYVKRDNKLAWVRADELLISDDVICQEDVFDSGD
jgi:intein/homing endonuclease